MFAVIFHPVVIKAIVAIASVVFATHEVDVYEEHAHEATAEQSAPIPKCNPENIVEKDVAK